MKAWSQCIVITFLATFSLKLFANGMDGINKYYQDLMNSSFDEIMQNYTIIPDFSTKEATRPIGNHTFWSYPFKIPSWQPSLDYQVENLADELPKTMGVGRAIEHLNKGRILYLQGKYKEARDTWLSARARYGDDNPKWLRRCLYFIGLGLLKMAEALGDPKYLDEVGLNLRETHYGNAALFLSEAFVLRRTPEDQLIDKYKTKVLSQLSKIYYVFKRYNPAFVTAKEGLDQVRITGITNYRASLLKMMAESMIRNRSYYQAVNYLDTLIRTTLDPEIAAESFSRIGDIYFDLNNYELAEAMYGLSLAVNRRKARLSPWQSILRGESLFWLKRYNESVKMLRLGIEASRDADSVDTLTAEAIAFATLRKSDNQLVRSRVDPLQLYASKSSDPAELKLLSRGYFSVEHQFPSTQAAEIASLRRQCIEDLAYSGKHVRHTRDLMDRLRKTIAPQVAREFAHACYVKSYTSRSFKKDVISKIEEFFEAYPYSKYLDWMKEALILNRRQQLGEYLRNKQHAKATLYYEANKEKLFQNLSKKYQMSLFDSYVTLEKSQSAFPFWMKLEKFLIEKNPFLSLVFAVEVGLDNQTVQRIVDSLDKSKIAIPNDSFHRSLGNRIWESDYDVAKNWYLSDLQDEDMETKRTGLFCTFVFPKISDSVQSKHEDLQLNGVSYLVYLVERTFPLWLQDDPGCAVDILNVELTMQRELVVSTWLSRLKWPVDEKTIRYYWIAAEAAREAGEMDNAKVLWAWIRDNTKEDTTYRRFASARLTPIESELDQLWTE